MAKVKKILSYLMVVLALTMLISLLDKERKLTGKLAYNQINFPTALFRNSKKGVLPPFIIIVCANSNGSETSSSLRQMRQVTVLLKSAVTFTKETLRFLVLTNSEDVFNQIKNIPSRWPDKYRSRLKFESGIVWYPSDRDQMKNLLRPCSTARLFLPETLRDIDAAVLVDTDSIFLRPPEELLKIIHKFNGSQAAGMVQTSLGYAGGKIPYPKPNGVNTGVIVMNMTRLRALPGGWTGVTLKAFDQYGKNLSAFITNDIINIAVGQHPEIFYDLDCVWNYNTGSCVVGTNICPKAEKTGVYLLHGTNGVFIRDRNPRFRSVFEAWEDYQLGLSLPELLEDIKVRLKRRSTVIEVVCKNMSSLDYMFTKSLETILAE